MIDKVQKIREEVARIQLYTQSEVLKQILDFIDSLQEEPVSEDMWEASKQYALRQVLASTDTEMTEQAYLSLKLFSGFEIAVAHKDGAKWQRQQDNNDANHALVEQIKTQQMCYEKGMVDMKQQMMKEAIDACVTNIRTYKEENEVDFTVMYEKGIIPYEIEQEVKVIVIK